MRPKGSPQGGASWRPGRSGRRALPSGRPAAGRESSSRRPAGGRESSSRTIVVAATLAVVLLAGLGALSCGGTELRGVVVIGVDTLRADHLGLYGHSRDTSPSLDRLAEGAAVFEHAYSTSSWTLPAFASMLTGQHPRGHGAGVRDMVAVDSRERGRLMAISGSRYTAIHPDVPTATERFEAAGFATGAVVQNPYMSPSLGLSRGFDTYDHLPGSNKQIRRADEALDRALEWIDGQDEERFFLFVHLFDPHLDYDPPAATRGDFTGDPRFGEFTGDAGFGELTLPVSGLWPIRNAGKEGLREGFVEFMKAAYDEEIRFVDREVGSFVEALQARGLWDELLVVLTADHGEEFFEHGGFEHGHDLHEEIMRVPLLVWGPGVEPGRRETPVSLADVAPTVLDAAGLAPLAGPPAGDDAAPGGDPASAMDPPRSDGGDGPATRDGGDGPATFGRSLWPSLVAGEEPEKRVVVAYGTLYGRTLEAAVFWPYKLIRRAHDRVGVLYDLDRDPGELDDIETELPQVRGGISAGLDRALNETALDVLSERVDLDESTLEALRSLGYIR